MNNNELKTNILIIGRSGVGKSSLLNYIFDDNIEKTGGGHPITGKGLFPHKYKRNPDDDMTFVIHDSWGLEPDKSEEWTDMVLEEISAHEEKDISEWFSTIIYCLNAVSGRVEEFELEMMNKFRKSGNSVVIAITHCNENLDDPIYKSAEAMKKRILNNTDIQSDSIVFVSSYEKKTIGGCTKRFGKEKIISQIIRNLWLNFRNKIPAYTKEYVDKKMKEQHDLMHKMVCDTLFLFKRKEKFDQFSQKINDDFSSFIDDIISDVNGRFNDAYEYYRQLSLRYFKLGFYLNKENLYDNSNMFFDVTKEFKVEIDDRINEIIESSGKIVKFMTEKVSKELLSKLALEIKTNIRSQKHLREDIHKMVDKHIKNAKEQIMKEIDDIQRKLMNTEIPDVCLLADNMSI